MADFIVSPYAISFNSIKSALETYISTKSDVTTTWSDFYTAGAGQTILELDAAIGAFYAFHFIIGRRESYLSVAQNYSSILGAAQSLGYNASRGHNVYLNLIIKPTVTMSLAKWTVIGSYAEYDVVLWEPAIINAGVETTLKCVIGNSSVQAITITSADLQQFVFTSSLVTDDCRLILNSLEVPVSSELKDAVNDNYIMLSNSYGAVDVFYLNDGNYNYVANDVLYLHYIERNSLTFSSLSTGSFALDLADEVTSIEIVEDWCDKEGKEHIRACAGVYHETNNVVRARKDYVKFLLQNNNFLYDANDKDISAGLIALCYLKEENEQTGSLLSTEEKEEYYESITSICPDGVASIFIEDPIKIMLNLSINIWQNADETLPASISDVIESILSGYENKLESTLDLDQIEHDIVDQTGAKIARLDLGATDYDYQTAYKKYDLITTPKILIGTEEEEWTMYCQKINAKSGTQEPDWVNTPNVGDIIIDNNIVWQNTNKYASSSIAQWSANTVYDLYDDISVGYQTPSSSTSATEPLWGSTIIADGNITWNKLKQYYYPLQNRADLTGYALNEYVIMKDNLDAAVYYAQALTHKTDQQEPDWTALSETDEITDNGIIWALKYAGLELETSYSEGALVGVGVDDILYIYCAAMDLTSSEINPLDGTDRIYNEDNELLWYVVETYSNLKEWAPQTEFDLTTYCQGDNSFYQVVNTGGSTTGENINFKDEETNEWLTEVIDNNICWNLDSVTVAGELVNCTGTTWQASTAFSQAQILIIETEADSYVYQASYVNTETTSQNSIVYSACGIAGMTGSIEPSWDTDTVYDNNILWTKTINTGVLSWSALTAMKQGDIIATNSGNYIFTSILGTSSQSNPNWAGISNNIITDNNIVWQKLEDTTSFNLDWNEYLDLTYTYKIVG